MAEEGGEGDVGTRDVEAIVRTELREQFDHDLRVTCHAQGDALDVHVELDGLEAALADALDGRRVQQYSTLRFTVARR